VLGHLLTIAIHRLGPFGVALGAALEGETAVMIGGTAAGHGLFSPLASGLAACAGSLLADQLVFWVSRHERQRPWVRQRLANPAVSRALHFLERHPRLFCFGFRFVYGFRIAGPAAVGISSVPASTFIVLNALSAAVWAALFTWLGYRFGAELLYALSPVLQVPHIVVEALVFAVVLAVAAIWARRR
jgi:membrane protein DedA with SNARE-associated domain